VLVGGGEAAEILAGLEQGLDVGPRSGVELGQRISAFR
jgi:hypothetical protein